MFSGVVLHKGTLAKESKQDTRKVKKNWLPPEQKASPGEHFAHWDVPPPGGVGSPKIYRLSI
jgi:hypothetical protein